ncbi:MAG: TadE/TadG family type IV pilus assembly protein [Bryobacteraceae bacterium]
MRRERVQYVRRTRRRGSAIVEFALSFGFLFSVFAGIFQFGYAYFVYNQLENAVRGGARYASLADYDSLTETPSVTFETAVRNMVLYGNPGGTGSAIVPALSASNITVTATMERRVPATVSVMINGYRLDAVVTSIVLDRKPKVTFPYMGRFAPPPAE